MDYEEMKRLEKTHMCTECGSSLAIVAGEGEGERILVCGKFRSHQGYSERPSSQALIARGQGDRVLGTGGQEQTEKVIRNTREQLSLMAQRDLGSGDVLARDRAWALIQWATQYALRPYLGHVCLYFGRPYVTIDGYYYLLNKRNVGIRVGTRPLTQDERRDYQIGEHDYAWLAEAWIGNMKIPTTGLGIATHDELEGKSDRDPSKFRAPVARSHPQRMAEKRAEWQLLRKLTRLEGDENVDD